MAFNIERVGAFYDKEILKYPTGLEAVKNVVIDATKLVANKDNRFIVEAGTVLEAIEGSQKVKPAEKKEVEAAKIVGIMHHTIEFFGNTGAAYDEPGAAFFWNCIFDTTKLVQYTENAAAVKTALNSCRFE